MPQQQVNKIILVLGGVLTVGIVFILYRRLVKADKQPSSYQSEYSKKTRFCKYQGFPLRYGSCGNEVIQLQRLLNTMTKAPLTLLKVDGQFGSMTQNRSKLLLGTTTVTPSILKRARTKLTGTQFKWI